MILLSFVLFIHLLGIILFDKFVYISPLYTQYLRVAFPFVSVVIELYVMLIKHESGFTFGLVCINIIICSFFVCHLAQKISMEKMLKSNPMGSINVLINEHDTKEIANIVQKVILYHKNNCDESKCVLCSSLRASIKKEISYDVLCTMLFLLQSLRFIFRLPYAEKLHQSSLEVQQNKINDEVLFIYVKKFRNVSEHAIYVYFISRAVI